MQCSLAISDNGNDFYSVYDIHSRGHVEWNFTERSIRYIKISCTKPEADGVGFYPVKSGVTIPAGKAYLVIDAKEVKGFLALDDVADAINNILVETANGNIFNIAGQKVQNITKGGLYIVNGKKVIVK